jgi:endonuclease YncB( thermonuclease family)
VEAGQRCFFYRTAALCGDIVRKTLSLIGLLAALASPAAALAANTVDPTLIPDGTYNATVEKVVDGKHITVKMENGVETTLTTNRSNVDFGKVHANDQIKMSLIKGMVAVYMVTK